MIDTNKPGSSQWDRDRFVFALASPGDSDEILEILEEGHYSGKMRLLYTRRDDAFASLMKEGEEVNIITCRDTLHNTIASIGACALRTLYVNGEPARVGYLFNLKTRSRYRKMFRFLHKGYDYCRQVLENKNSPFCLMTILEGNEYAIKLLEKRRSFMPDHYPLGTYEVYAFKTRMRCKSIPGLDFRQCTRADMAAVVRFLNERGKNYQFFPVVNLEDFQEENITGPCFKDFYGLYNDRGELVACGAVWDQKKYKQYIIKGYKGFLKYIAPVSTLLPVFGYPHMLSKPNTVLNFFTLSFWAVKDNNPVFFNYFVKNISRCSGEYRFFVIGLHETNHLKKALTQIPHFSYKSKIYLVDWEKTGNKLSRLDKNRVPYLECGTL
jgi:hypothetical protein